MFGRIPCTKWFFKRAFLFFAPLVAFKLELLVWSCTLHCALVVCFHFHNKSHICEINICLSVQKHLFQNENKFKSKCNINAMVNIHLENLSFSIDKHRQIPKIIPRLLLFFSVPVAFCLNPLFIMQINLKFISWFQDLQSMHSVYHF